MAVKKGDKIKVEYTGTLEDGTVFDSSEKQGQPLEFEAGSGQLIKGFDDCVIGMEKGRRKRSHPSTSRRIWRSKPATRANGATRSTSKRRIERRHHVGHNYAKRHATPCKSHESNRNRRYIRT